MSDKKVGLRSIARDHRYNRCSVDKAAFPLCSWVRLFVLVYSYKPLSTAIVTRPQFQEGGFCGRHIALTVKTGRTWCAPS